MHIVIPIIFGILVVGAIASAAGAGKGYGPDEPKAPVPVQPFNVPSLAGVQGLQAFRYRGMVIGVYRTGLVVTWGWDVYGSVDFSKPKTATASGFEDAAQALRAAMSWVDTFKTGAA